MLQKPYGMYRSCLFCHHHLGANADVPGFPVGERLAFDAERGRLWVVCVRCGRWNLTPLEERWEAIEECERRFRATALRFSTDNIGLARLSSGLELIRIGRALRPEIAAWRYGHHLGWPMRRPGGGRSRTSNGAAVFAGRAVSAIARSIPRLRLGYDASTWLRIHRRADRIIDTTPIPGGGRAVIRYRHLESAELLRPDRLEPWRLVVRHESGMVTLTGNAGLGTAGKLLAAINGAGAGAEQVQSAVRKLEDAGNPDGYFARIAALALRTSWGRFPNAPRDLPVALAAASDAERLALYLTNRSFWGRGGIGSEPRTVLPQLPMVDRLALEMAAHEDAERRALEGELKELEAAWREAEEIAAIADSLLDERTEVQPAWAPRPVWGSGFMMTTRSHPNPV